MKMSAMVAKAKNGVIGVDNQLPWHLPQDLKHFKNVTSGKTVVMGRKTFESIGRPLPNRRNLVLTREEEYVVEGCEVLHSVEEVIRAAETEEEVMIIGGEQIYNLFMPMINKLYVTEVDMEVMGDAFFQTPADFELLSEETHHDGLVDGQQITYSFQTYQRKK